MVPSTTIQPPSLTRSVYRQLYHILRQQSVTTTNTKQMQQLREGFRRPLSPEESLESRLEEARNKLSFLRLSTPKSKQRRPSTETSSNGTERYVYKNGERLTVSDGGGTLRDGNGKVVSNWDGNNLDPDSVRRHRQQLRRVGFVNNAHAKGIF